MSDEKLIFGLDLDAKDFIEKLQGVNKKLEELAGEHKLDGLVAGLKKAALAAGALIAAYAVIKTAVDTVFEAENIKQVNFQFEQLTKNAGISGEALKEGLDKASNGLIDNTDLLKIANKSLVTMGESAKRLPEILDLARKSTTVFGGELVDNFEKLNFALSTGNQRALKTLGITVDTEKAVREYAAANRVAVDAIDDTGRRQAVLNAVLAQGKKAFKDVPEGTKEARIAFDQLIVSIKDMSETLTLAFDKVAGPTIKTFLQNLKAMSKDFSQFITANFGEGKAAVDAQYELISDKIVQIQAKILKYKEVNSKEEGFFSKLFGSRADIDKVIKENQKELDDLLITQKNLYKEIELAKADHEEKLQTDKPNSSTGVDQEKQKQITARFEQDLYRLREQRIQKEIEIETNQQRLTEQDQELRFIMFKDMEAKVSEISTRKNLDEEQKRQLAIQLEANLNSTLLAMDEALVQKRIEIAERRVYKAKDFDEQLAASAQASAMQVAYDYKKAGGDGGAAFKSFSSKGIAALKAVGDGSKAPAEALKDAFLGALGDIAIQKGTVMMLTAFDTFPIIKVPQLVAGAALVTLGSALGAASGGGAAAASAGGGNGGAGSGASGRVDGAGASVAQTEAPRKSVTVAIQGNYYDTDQTRMRLLEMIREATDATDFKYTQVGQN